VLLSVLPVLSALGSYGGAFRVLTDVCCDAVVRGAEGWVI
jgi:hypothetical protein